MVRDGCVGLLSAMKYICDLRPAMFGLLLSLRNLDRGKSLLDELSCIKRTRATVDHDEAASQEGAAWQAMLVAVDPWRRHWLRYERVTKPYLLTL